MIEEFNTIDDLLNDVLTKLIELPSSVKVTRGTTSEITGALLTLTNPRARLSSTETKGTAFSAIGELLWYLSGSNELEFIEQYIKAYKKESKDGKTIYGAYGPRLLAFRGYINQIENVIQKLKRKPTSRKAVIQIFDAEDLVSGSPEIPCTCNLQFLIRNGNLNMYVSMRSNDAFLGLSHDIFTFTMLQELVARSLNVKLGWYKHAVCSLHLYENARERVIQYLNEGFQPTKNQSMPQMPDYDPWPSVIQLIKIEEQIRKGYQLKEEEYKDLPPYWVDIATLIQIHFLFKEKRFSEIKIISKNFHDSVYYPYIAKRLRTKLK